MAAVSCPSLQRRPFGELDPSRLKVLSAQKNRQNGTLLLPDRRLNLDLIAL